MTAGTIGMFLEGTVLAPGTVYRGGQVAVDGSGAITCVGCDCRANAASATVVSCPSGVISPGLINTHDHITYTQNAPSVDTTGDVMNTAMIGGSGSAVTPRSMLAAERAQHRSLR